MKRNEKIWYNRYIDNSGVGTSFVHEVSILVRVQSPEQIGAIAQMVERLPCT